MKKYIYRYIQTQISKKKIIKKIFPFYCKSLISHEQMTEVVTTISFFKNMNDTLHNILYPTCIHICIPTHTHT